MKTRTLEQIIEEQRKQRFEGGDFGIAECKKAIVYSKEQNHESYFIQLENFLECANSDIFFNKLMVLACWELINEL